MGRSCIIDSSPHFAHVARPGDGVPGEGGGGGGRGCGGSGDESRCWRRAGPACLEYFRGTNFIYIMGIILLAKSKLEGESEREPPPPSYQPPLRSDES